MIALLTENVVEITPKHLYYYLSSKITLNLPYTDVLRSQCVAMKAPVAAPVRGGWWQGGALCPGLAKEFHEGESGT